MKYQIEVSKVLKGRKTNTVRLKPRLSIEDVAYWQERIAWLLDKSDVVTCRVAKNEVVK